MSLSTHVLDATTGRPAVGMRVRLEAASATSWTGIADAVTDDDGRIRDAFPHLAGGVYRLVFDTGGYFAARRVEAFYPEIAVAFTVADPAAHHHVPLLLSPFAYSTYRGS